MANKINIWSFSLFIAHVFAAFYCPILDCDEVFNYWEPLHNIVYGNGLQTWEYAGSYALRSYLYLLFHSPVVFCAKFVGFSKLQIFYTLRIGIAFFTTMCEAHWLDSLEMRLGPRIKAWTHFFLLVSPGMFIASAAFIPSSFSMSCLLLCQSFQLRRNVFGSIFSGAVAVILGWPFCTIILLPIGISLVINHGLISCLGSGVLSLVLTAVPTIIADTFYYLPIKDQDSQQLIGVDKDVLITDIPIAIWSSFNLVVYNMFPHGTGSELYGTESWHFYLRNLGLNFNLILIFSLLSFILLIIFYVMSFIPSKYSVKNDKFEKVIKNQRVNCINAIFWNLPFFIWFIFLTLLPHKEERFMFVVYPQLCFAAAITFVLLETGILAADSRTSKTMPPFGSVGPSSSRLPSFNLLRNRLLFIGAIVTLLLSLARSAALVNHYGAPMEVYSWLSHHIEELDSQTTDEHASRYRVCVGKEWYRFPSHFFLPENTEIMFVKSGFHGELPRYFNSEYGTHGPWGGVLFNDLNQLQNDIFVDITTCDYVIDLELLKEEEDIDDDDDDDDDDGNSEPWFQNSCGAFDGQGVCLQQSWTSIYSTNFLDAANTPTLPRIFHVPLWVNAALFRQKPQYILYHVLRSGLRK